MSMLSAQVDELRKAARGQKAMGLFDLAQMLKDAADTITELRGALQVASVDYRHLESENAKLRELVSDFDKCLTEAARLAYIQGHMTIYDGTLLDSLHPRMRELGVEVDDG